MGEISNRDTTQLPSSQQNFSFATANAGTQTFNPTNATHLAAVSVLYLGSGFPMIARDGVSV
jgi:hypothetical protein